MIFRRLLFFLAGATALAVSAGIVVVALAFALYALATPYVGRAGGAAIVALAAALLIGLIGFALTRQARPRPRKPGYLGSLLRAFMEGREPPGRGRRGR